jgi:hypothetical protein
VTYQFVQAYHDLGRRRGPILGFTVHMAEGGGTVGFLSRANRYAVSVHWVIQYDGDIVQMLREDHMHTSIRITGPDGVFGSALRRTDDADGFYGGTAARAVLGDWAYVASTLGPNHATVAVEIEGFRAVGPNPAQAAALVGLVADVRTRHPSIGLLGHRDHNLKGCPGTLINWSALGGHGSAQEEPDLPGVNFNPASLLGTVTVNASGAAYFNPATRVYFQITTVPREFPVHGAGVVPDKPENPGAFRGQPIWVADVGGCDVWLRKVDAGLLVPVPDPTPFSEADVLAARAEGVASVVIPPDTTPVSEAQAVAREKAARAGALEDARNAGIKGVGDAIDALA